MKSIHSKNTIPEMDVRTFLHNNGLRYRLHQRGLPGSPDLVLKRYNAVVFVHGCFWHQHNKETCPHSKMPKSNVNYWKPKLMRNVKRDEDNKKKLILIGWRVFEIWECEIDDEHLAKVVLTIRAVKK